MSSPIPLSSRPTKRRRLYEESPPTLNTGQAEASTELARGPPVPVPTPSTHLLTAIDDDQPSNPGGTVLSTSVVSLQPPSGSLYGTTNDDDQTTNQRYVISRLASIAPMAPSFFTGAHHFTIDQMTAIDNLTVDNTSVNSIVIEQLIEKGKPAAIHDSAARAYPPRCHPDTRKKLKSRLSRWGVGDGSNERMFWVLGPTAIGKSAIAQTIAEEFNVEGRLCATFFFSRPNQVDNPDWVIPTLVYQLATRHQPLLIIIDGLDKCRDKKAQQELIDLIGTHTRQVDRFPLRWMVCSRPEWHLRSRLSNPDFHVVCERHELEIDDTEAQRDVQRLLETGFENIWEEYEDYLPTGWPPQDDLCLISMVASGYLGFASFILRFIGNDQYSDPDSQLGVCMKFIGGGGGTIGAINPLHALDLLYRQILSDVPVNTEVLPPGCTVCERDCVRRSLWSLALNTPI
ncbi:hypothetical protein P691DRAFT_780046 [Macrolepiota fuliginosa MF-IS2]|uniref:Nephrocystin 3-like N-terminal domain-containing protein n=1 Tax=Macrolepiota fuliginosa MF-IS2 TaxID=1400762 RepID=A0A9P6BWB5_9AGAR|nr:hypothetical protein P691DRAFT_780046 [Macrolepiota fuliginosa MF-IS2]